jgi:pimeloyl-ACP methyl ester carboxylesterase
VQRLVTVLLAAGLALVPGRASAQAERFELGRHLRAFEAVWQQRHTDEQARKRALVPLRRATTAFFTGNPGPVGKALDLARFALLSDKEPPAAVLWAESLYVKPDARLVDSARAELPLTLTAFYPTENNPPAGAKLVLTLSDPAAGKVLASAEADIAAVPQRAQIPLKGVPEGDLTLRAEVVVAGKVLASEEQTVSCVAGLSRRLTSLRKAAEALPRENADTQQETVRGLAGLLEALQSKVLETNYPAARLLAEAEESVKEVSAGRPYFGRKRPGQFWLTLAVQGGAVTARLAAPEAVAKGEPLPLVIVLHGSGGSENMFFDAHGPGLIVRLCRERGWLLVAPRSQGGNRPPRALDIITEVDKLYPVDRKRVYLVGHSMGAFHAVALAQQAPERYAGVGALSGGTQVRPTEALKDLPFFVGAGSADFLLGGVRGLNESLKKAGVRKVRYREYADVEHVEVVVLALKDIFEFFDETAKK